jgi:hypothetical protein
VTNTVDAPVTGINPRATRKQIARDLLRARGRIVALVEIVDAHAATIKDLREEVQRVKRIAHDLNTDLEAEKQKLARIALISAVAGDPLA